MQLDANFAREAAPFLALLFIRQKLGLPPPKVLVYRGYLMVWYPLDPRSKRYAGYYFQHRLIAERGLGRRLRRGEEVHHVNGNKKDNRWPENLRVMTEAQHAALHKRLGWGRPGGKPIRKKRR